MAEHASDEPFELVRQEAVEGALVRALPLITDVVEAAEREVLWTEIVDGGGYDLGERTGGDIGRALTALRDALQGEAGSPSVPGAPTAPYIRPAEDPHTLVAKALSGDALQPEGDRT